ncbi:hypothetical protein CDAR_507971 [Caerostris darwini]|uniref:Uncharacterized protein n=1 Tax=Caerostris darwini TaxID=1538125 RepID=A0AAV4RQ28_9ARAC|nr:hypothetical protein CDAR_507971 [Caerostris darwini]
MFPIPHCKSINPFPITLNEQLNTQEHRKAAYSLFTSSISHSTYTNPKHLSPPYYYHPRTTRPFLALISGLVYIMASMGECLDILSHLPSSRNAKMRPPVKKCDVTYGSDLLS